MMPVGGQWHPISGTVARLLWKNAQKKPAKNITSEVINRAIPQRRPTTTGVVWWPRMAASRETSRHHWNMVRRVNSRAKIRVMGPKLCIHMAKPPVRRRPLMEPTRGQGLGSTR